MVRPEGVVALKQVGREDIVVGEPLQWSLFDAQGNLLIGAGEVLGQSLLDQLLKPGLYRQAAEPQGNEPLLLSEGAPSGLEGELLRSEQVQLQPGDALQLQPLPERNGERYAVRVIGHMIPVSLLVTAPTSNGKLVFVREGQRFLVRGFVGKDAVAYKTRVLRTSMAPFPYIHLEYPETVQAMRIRQSARVSVDLMVSVAGPAGAATGHIADLSVGGARVVSPRPIGEAGQEIKLSFRVNPAGVEAYMHLRARVRGVQQEEGGGRFSTGLEFHSLTEQDRLYLMNVVYQKLLKDPIC